MRIPLLDRAEAVRGCFNHLSHDVAVREPYSSQEAWRAALDEFIGTGAPQVVEVTEDLRRLELKESGATRSLPYGPVAYSGSAADHRIRTYDGPIAICPACIQPLGKHVFALGAAYSWQHFPEQEEGVDCPSILDDLHDGDVIHVTPNVGAWRSLRDWYPDCSGDD
ncbi:hypothetical protein ACFV8Z_24165 [Streptomyces sp. NPDC059837]|uniref:hypothetical protein n=1 Tax=Streptomyces sp. NPDC059837 TaxID=3346968 RepID=UPI00365548D1